jgi:hypothetical protein
MRSPALTGVPKSPQRVRALWASLLPHSSGRLPEPIEAPPSNGLMRGIDIVKQAPQCSAGLTSNPVPLVQ